jgi:hypothetical protein
MKVKIIRPEAVGKINPLWNLKPGAPEMYDTEIAAVRVVPTPHLFGWRDGLPQVIQGPAPEAGGKP